MIEGAIQKSQQHVPGSRPCAAGPKVVAIAALGQTCRRLNLNLRGYLQAVRPQQRGEWPIPRVTALTPTAWKAAQRV